jgi:hypothetical protein
MDAFSPEMQIDVKFLAIAAHRSFHAKFSVKCRGYWGNMGSHHALARALCHGWGMEG